MHGHDLDTVVQNARWLAETGDVGYQFLLWLNRPLNLLRRIFGLGYFSLSAYAKRKVKSAVNYIGKFEEAIARYANDENGHGVVCGHIHAPVVRQNGGVTYFNCGDCVDPPDEWRMVQGVVDLREKAFVAADEQEAAMVVISVTSSATLMAASAVRVRSGLKSWRA